MTLLKLTLILGIMCHMSSGVKSAPRSNQDQTPDDDTSPSFGHNTTQNWTAVTESYSSTNSTKETKRVDLIVTAVTKTPNHRHVSVSIIAVAAGGVLLILALAWCVYARQFPTSGSGQILIRVKYVLQKRQPELHAYRSVNGPI